MAMFDAQAQTGATGPTLLGRPIKQVSLVTLTFQNSILILVVYYSRVMPPTSDYRYFTSTAVLLSEIIKLAVSLTFAIHETSRTLASNTPVTVLFEQISHAVFSWDSWKLAIPAALYTLQNTLQYVALGNLDPVHFQVLYQLNILTTAAFSVVLLGRSLGTKRWLALVLLTLGISIVSLTSDSNATSLPFPDFGDDFFPRSLHELGHVATDLGEAAAELTKRAVSGVAEFSKRSATYQGIQEDQNEGHKHTVNSSVGLVAVLLAAVASSLSGVYFEKVLKDSQSRVSVWTRNIQLSFYSLFPAFFIGVLLKDGDAIAQQGFFTGYNWVVWTTIVLQAIGGILASLCIQYADNITKNFATSISIVISFLFSVWFFDFSVTFSFVSGTAIVLLSTYLYNGPDRKRGRPPPINIVSYEKAAIDGTPTIVDEGRLGIEPLVGITTSRPSSPMLHHSRASSARGKRFDD